MNSKNGLWHLACSQGYIIFFTIWACFDILTACLICKFIIMYLLSFLKWSNFDKIDLETLCLCTFYLKITAFIFSAINFSTSNLLNFKIFGIYVNPGLSTKIARVSLESLNLNLFLWPKYTWNYYHFLSQSRPYVNQSHWTPS